MRIIQKGTFLSPRVHQIPIDEIRPNPQQPRREFCERELHELSESIAAFGILQPLTVRKQGGTYELVAGERRLRAAKLAGLKTVPCLTAKVEQQDAGLLALLENVQRCDLNCFEEADAIAALLRHYRLSQEEVAQKLGKSQSAVANKLRLLRLAPTIRTQITQNGLTERHGRALLRLPDETAQRTVLQTVIDKGLNVARTEELIEQYLHAQQAAPPQHRPSYVVKDVRLFLNTIAHSLDVMRTSGVDAAMERCDTEEAILLTIRIPRKNNLQKREKMRMIETEKNYV